MAYRMAGKISLVSSTTAFCIQLSDKIQHPMNEFQIHTLKRTIPEKHINKQTIIPIYNQKGYKWLQLILLMLFF